MENIIIIIVAIVAGISTYTISIIMKKGTVFASAAVTLVAGIIIPYFFEGLRTQLTAVAACASYAGMISAEIANIKEMIAVSVIVGIIYTFTFAAYEGIGGRLGTIAALSCFVFIGLRKIFIRKKQYNKIKISGE